MVAFSETVEAEHGGEWPEERQLSGEAASRNWLTRPHVFTWVLPEMPREFSGGGGWKDELPLKTNDLGPTL